MRIRALWLLAVPVLAACSGPGDSAVGASSPPPAEVPETVVATTISGWMVLDGTTNGCGDEQITVEVGSGPPERPTAAVVGSTFFGFDCAFEFDMEVPVLPCYEVTIDGTPVGRYPGNGAPERIDVGFVDPANVYGPEGEFEPPTPYSDGDYC